MTDFYIEQYKTEFAGKYDRNSDEFNADLDRLIRMAYSAGATAEKYRILDAVKNRGITFGVETFVKDTTKIISVQVEKYLKEVL